ncbi:MAG: hypothetical protein GF398_03230, partial [Chitinivibrionales bacterium]|nr:hypothetical protein [Chitinivibrionales bacterium]
LQVFLVSAPKTLKPPKQWKLVFNLRQQQQDIRHRREAAPQEMIEEHTACVAELLSSRFDLSILKQLEKSTGQRKENWHPAWLRKCWRILSETLNRRDQGAEYEAGWLNAAGFFLRPGYGVTLDDHRVGKLWNVYELGLANASVKSVREQWYIMWRRVSGGLGSEQQLRLFADVHELIAGHTKHAAEAMRMAASFELLSEAQKENLYCLLMAGVSTRRPKHRGAYLWSLGRLLGRIPLYAGDQAILPPRLVETCFETLRDQDWRETGMEYASTLFALACRKTGQMGIDISQAVREAVVAKMRSARAREELIDQVIRYVPVKQGDLTLIYGESLPSGLALRSFS